MSGMRNDCEVEIWVDVAAAEACGLTFSVLNNGVVFTEGPDALLPFSKETLVTNSSQKLRITPPLFWMRRHPL